MNLLSRVQTCCVSPYRISVDGTPYHLSVAKCWYGDTQRAVRSLGGLFPSHQRTTRVAVVLVCTRCIALCFSAPHKGQLESIVITSVEWSKECIIHLLDEYRKRDVIWNPPKHRNFVALHRLIRNGDTIRGYATSLDPALDTLHRNVSAFTEHDLVWDWNPRYDV
jgi:hypothetical protein